MFNIIPSDKLTIEDVPNVDADIHEINKFALTYDNALGIINTNFDAMVTINNNFQYMSLIELRLVLYAEQRKASYLQYSYPKELEQKIRNLIFEIRFRLEHK